jgi:hypothetical protein
MKINEWLHYHSNLNMLSVHLIVPKVSLLPQYFSQKETKKPHCIAKDKSKLYIA